MLKTSKTRGIHGREPKIEKRACPICGIFLSKYKVVRHVKSQHRDEPMRAPTKAVSPAKISITDIDKYFHENPRSSKTEAAVKRVLVDLEILQTPKKEKSLTHMAEGARKNVQKAGVFDKLPTDNPTCQLLKTFADNHINELATKEKFLQDARRILFYVGKKTADWNASQNIPDSMILDNVTFQSLLVDLAKWR